MSVVIRKSWSQYGTIPSLALEPLSLITRVPEDTGHTLVRNGELQGTLKQGTT